MYMPTAQSCWAKNERKKGPERNRSGSFQQNRLCFFGGNILKADEPQDGKGSHKCNGCGDQGIDNVHGVLAHIQADGCQTGTAAAKAAHTGKAGVQAAQTAANGGSDQGLAQADVTPNRAGSVTPSRAVTPPETAS